MTPVPKTGHRTVPLLAAMFAAFLAPLPALADTAPQTIGGQPVVQLAAGGDHTCALVGSGRVFCWGRNDVGQLGDGSRIDRLTPVQVSLLNRVTEVSAGDQHSCALRDTGRVFCWGANLSGERGNGTTEPWERPLTRVHGMFNVTHVVAGQRHGCALRDTGRVWCWGSNQFGQLGVFPAGINLFPVRVRDLEWAYQLTAGRNHSCAVAWNGGAFCWGQNSYGQLGDGTRQNRRRAVPVVN